MSDRFSRAMATRNAVRAERGPVVVPQLPPLNEKAWLGQVVHLAQIRKWKVYHTHDSRHSAAGFPDLVLCRPPRLVFAELKTDRKGSNPTTEQYEWLQILGDCEDDNLRLEVHVWRPSDFDEMQEVLW